MSPNGVYHQNISEKKEKRNDTDKERSLEFGGRTVVLRDGRQRNATGTVTRGIPRQQNVRCGLGAAGKTFLRDSIRYAWLWAIQPCDRSALPPRRSGSTTQASRSNRSAFGWMFQW